MEPTQQETPKAVSNSALPISIIVAALIIGAGLYFGLQSKQVAVPQNADGTKAGEIVIKQVTKDDHIIGNPNAKVLIVEFSDTECPFCKVFHATLHKVMDKYGKNGDVAWVYRHFPIDQLHPKARKEAEATECAAELGGPDAFWKYIDLVYSTTPSNNKLDPAELPIIAKNIGLDVNAFNTCLTSGKYASKVESNYQDAVKAGGQGTPYTVIVTKEGKLPITQGAISFEQMSQLIDQILASLK